jgi:hypothetical protein
MRRAGRAFACFGEGNAFYGIVEGSVRASAAQQFEQVLDQRILAHGFGLYYEFTPEAM